MRPHVLIRPALVVAAFGIALAAASNEMVLEAGVPAGPQEWSRGAGSLAAPGHALAPVLTVGSGAMLDVTLPGGGIVRMTPVALGTRGPGGASLPKAGGWLDETSAPNVALIHESWLGVDEAFTLRADSIKHDLLVSEAAANRLGSGDVVATWSLVLPPGMAAVQHQDGSVRIERAGRAVAEIPAPLVGDAAGGHSIARVASFELGGPSGAPTLSMVVPGDWFFDSARKFPVRLDPTISVFPTMSFNTGFVDEFSDRLTGEINSGSLTLVGFGSDVRGYAEFDTSAIPDGAAISSVHMQIWLANHDNPGDPAVPLHVEYKGVGVRASEPENILWNAIGGLGAGVIYATENVPRTGPEFCPDSYVFRDYDLGPVAVADLQGLLGFDFFTVGFNSNIVTDPDFDHMDYVGYDEFINNPFGCAFTDFPGTRIRLVVTFASNRPPVCNAGGPYLADCPNGPIVVDASGSSDPDGDPLSFAWTTTCPGTFADPTQAIATLDLEGGCAADCTVTVTVTDSPGGGVGGGSSVSCTTTVTAHDVTPPEIVSSDLTAYCLWPPRHDFFPVGLASDHVVARDACQPNVTMRWSGCASDQPDEAREPGRPENGDGHFPGDCFVTPDGQLFVRVERAGHDPVGGRNTFVGRHYGVAVEVDDGCGNVVTVPGSLVVPHDRRGGSGGQDDPCSSGVLRIHR